MAGILGNPEASVLGTLSFSRNRNNWRDQSPKVAPPFVVNRSDLLWGDSLRGLQQLLRNPSLLLR